MKLYPIAPDAESVARHFDRMASGKVHTSRGQRAGYGFLGSRINLGSYSVMKGGAGTKENPQTVRGITPTEVGIQQAKSELQAQSHVINTSEAKKKKTQKKKIKRKGATGKGQSKPGQRGSKTSKTSAKGRGAKKRKSKEEAVELKRLAASKKKKKKKTVKTAGKKKTDNFS